ncbi:MAG: NADH-quinone oxidoreductase subunit I [Deltaproteobacteria bacterium]|nr:NADH-quinone oxidoreductase subunit I [Deltaproteobacteria bacterium]
MAIVVQRKERLSLAERLYIPILLGGLVVTTRRFFRNLFHPENLVTVQYPEERRPISPQLRFRHRLTKREDGTPRCVACMCCPTACPANCIHIEPQEHSDPTIEKRPARFEIDLSRCVFCGLCVEACPCDAIRMDTGKLGSPSYQLKNMVVDIDFLLKG